MRLLVITTPDFWKGEEKAVTALFEAGLETLHLRKPNAGVSAVEAFLRQIPQEYYPRIVLHSHFELKEVFGLGGIHLNARNPKVPEDYCGQISCSCHSLSEVIDRKCVCSYVFLSPIYDSISKNGYQATFPFAVLRQACQDGIIDRQVVALGGICENNIAEVRQLGFGGIAVLGDLWQRCRVADDAGLVALVDHFVRLQFLAHG